MKLVHTCEPDIAPLAYCVRVSGSEAHLVHGSMVATGAGFFHDGAWAGDFAEPAFDRLYSCGTGGLVVGDSLRLATPEMPVECVFMVTHEGTTLASNSLAFLLEVLDDSLDPHHLGYRDEMLSVEHGVRLSKVTLATARGPRVRVLFDELADIGPSGGVTIRKRSLARAFHDFDDYITTVRRTLSELMTNASDPRREHTYEPLVPMSTGYDSTAVASLASELGATEAITMLRYGTDGSMLVDHPGEIAEALGMNLREVPRDTWRDRTDMPETHLAASLTGLGGVSLLALDEWLPGRLLLTGVSGDNVWDLHNHRYARDVVHGYGNLGGRSQVEHRLHVGYVRCSPAEIGHTAHPSIYRISHSAELSPWRIGGLYDRPIARRIAEETGVSRSSFGVKKYAASAKVGNARTYSSASTRTEMSDHMLEVMSSTAVESFLGYLEGIDRPELRSRMTTGRVVNRLYSKLDALNHRAGMKLHGIGIRQVVPRRVMRRLAQLGATDFDYTRWLPHWGIDHVKHTYASAGEATGSITTPHS